MTSQLLQLLNSPAYLAALLAVLGLIVGSFLNVVIWRLNAPLLAGGQDGGNLYKPRSYCPQCRNQLLWWQLIPLLSFIWLRARCYYCKQSISWQYPLVELATAIIFAALGWFMPAGINLLLWLAFSCWGLALCVSDWRWMLLPDSLSLSLLWYGLLINSLGLWSNLHGAVYGAAVGFALFWSVNALYKLIRKRDGMGGGDQKLLAALGACFGLQAVWPIVLIASVAGCLQALCGYLIRRQVQRAQVVIFGPWLIIAAVIYQLFLYWF